MTWMPCSTSYQRIFASRYPGTAAAKLAQARLDKMQKEGR